MKMSEIIAMAGVFFVSWIIASLIWAIWLDGIMVPIAGVLTAGMLVGAVTVGVNWRN